MKIHIAPGYRDADPKTPSFYDDLVSCAHVDRFQCHQFVDDPADADAILITEAWRHFDDWRYSRVRCCDMARRFPEKIYVYCDADVPMFILPGLYPSVSRQLIDPANQCSFCYFGEYRRRFENDPLIARTQPDLLFSFAGNVGNHPTRRRIMNLHHDRADLLDSAKVAQRGADAVHNELNGPYREQIARSKFVLCPRGKGPSSYRIFEVMAAGRVPVIISDAWVEPPGVVWTEVSLRVPERDIEQLPTILKKNEPEFETMARACREAYHRHFASTALFNYVGDSLERLARSRGTQRRFKMRHIMSYASRIADEGRRQVGTILRELARHH